MIEYFTEFSILWVAVMLGAMVPGADMVMIVRNTITGGRKLGVITAFGTSLAIGFHCAYTALGMGVLLAESPIFLKIIQYFGAFFLIFLGLRLWQKSFETKVNNITIDTNPAQISLSKGFQTGFLIDVLNPFAALYLISLLTTEISAVTPIGVRVIYVLGLTLSDFLFMVIIALVLSQKSWRQIFFNHIHWVNRLSGTVLLFIGGKFLIV